MNAEAAGFIHRKNDGRYSLDLSGRDLFLESLSTRIGKGRKSVRVILTVKEDSYKSSQAMRFYYGVVVTQIAIPFFKNIGETGINKDTAHLRLKYIVGFTEDVVNVRTGEIQTLPRSLATANADDVSEFIDDCIHFLEDQGCVVPRPDEYEKNQLTIG